jgi:CubicO group peptidase (beta-lactamase class C family)
MTVHSRRRHVLWLTSAVAGVCLNGGARAEGGNPLFGTWSGTSKDDENYERIKLIIRSETSAAIVFVEIGLSIDATATHLAGETVDLEFKSIGVRFKGVLNGRDTLNGELTQDHSERITFKRGDPYAVNNTVLAPGPMDTVRLTKLRAVSGAPGVGVAWARRGRDNAVLVDGLRAVGYPAPVGVTDKWHIGSCTKSMTATLVARLVEAGRLKWTATVREVLGGRLPDINPAYNDANLLHLLSHNAGLTRDAPTGGVRFTIGPMADPRGERLAYARLALRTPPIGPLAGQTSYSNAGYVVVGAMIETIMGQPWETLIAHHLFAPLRLASAGFGPPATMGKVDQPWGHVRGPDGRLRPEMPPLKVDLPTFTGPAGLVHINLSDLLTYLKAHRDHPTAFLREASWRVLQTPPFRPGYALGWGVDPTGVLTHTGSNGAWWAVVTVDRKAGLAFAYAQNAVTPEAQPVTKQALAAALKT